MSIIRCHKTLFPAHHPETPQLSTDQHTPWGGLKSCWWASLSQQISEGSPRLLNFPEATAAARRVPGTVDSHHLASPRRAKHTLSFSVCLTPTHVLHLH